MIATFHQASQAEEARNDVQRGGFDDVRLFTGVEVQAHHTEFLKHRTALQRLGAAISADEQDWDGTIRVAGSLKFGIACASDLIRAHQAGKRLSLLTRVIARSAGLTRSQD